MSTESSITGLVLSSSENSFEEVGFHKQLSKTFSDLKLIENCSVIKNKEGNNETKINKDQNMTPKSQKNKTSDVKRWASVVKAQKKPQLTESISGEKPLSEDVEITSEIFDCIFKTFPKSFENHKGFILIKDKMFYCNICSVNLDSVLNLSNHLKTRKHEDNVIDFLKEKLPAHLHQIMEFISFYSYSLCCNLCRCKINMNSFDPYETIVNIIVHNDDESHSRRKVNHDTYNGADDVMKCLSTSNPLIMENSHFIDKKMIPQFKCKLCNKMIVYNENVEILSQNFTSHLKTACHMKNLKAVEVLKLFGDASKNGKDNWEIVNGNITCTYCNRQFETNLQQLIDHVNDVEHATNIFFKLGISSSINKVQESNKLCQENLANEAKSLAINQHKNEESKENVKLGQTNERKFQSGNRLKELLKTMPIELQEIDYVIENEKGSITCVVCNRVVPPSTYNLRTHLLGSKHKSNVELKKGLDSKGSKYLKTQLNEKHDTEISSKQRISCSNNLANKKCINKQCSMCIKLKDIPNCIRLIKCREMETIPASVLNHLYSLLLNENDLIKKNENILVKNVDGKHSYCKECKSLIPLSLDLDVLENNLISHLHEKKHTALTGIKYNIGEIENSKNPSPNTTKVARTLFDFSSENNIFGKDSKVFSFQDFTNLISGSSEIRAEDRSHDCSVEKAEEITNNTEDRAIHKAKQSKEEIPKPTKDFPRDDNKVFIFGSEGESVDKKQETKKVTPAKSKTIEKKTVLPIKHALRPIRMEEETDKEVLSRRQKQIDYGKNTEGYKRYCLVVQRRKRGMHHPITPPKHLKCSRRTWDGLIRAWRRQLHAWDPPSSTLDADIRPLD